MNNFYQKEAEDIIGIKFNEPKLLLTALTHSSYANQHRDEEYNERFEFLGDAILQVCITEYLFLNYKEKSEGELTKIRSLIVCENSLYEIGKSLNLGYLLRMSKGEELTGGRERISLIADAVEALIAAIYLDGGMENAKKFIFDNMQEIIEDSLKGKIFRDYKTYLQEVLQSKGEQHIWYKLIEEKGPDHNKRFVMEVGINDVVLGVGEGKSKKDAEQLAAKSALKSQNL